MAGSSDETGEKNRWAISRVPAAVYGQTGKKSLRKEKELNKTEG